ncbi:MAG: VWA domain-containing protein [bacterium]|nr:VWA domain-containing protein [bacterium]
MRNHRFFVFFLLSVVCFVSVVDAAVVFLSPRSGDVWTGRQKIEVSVTGVPGGAAAKVEIYLDGRLIAALNKKPYVYTHDFGAGARHRTLKVLVKNQEGGTIAVGTLESLEVDDAHEVEVSQVVVPVVVKDESGNYIRGLEKKDFRLIAGGVEQEISYVKKSGTMQFNMALVIDISGSMQFKLRKVVVGARDFLTKLMAPNDRGAVVFFNEDVFEPSGLTTNLDELTENLSLETRAVGETALYDAVAYTLELLSSARGWNIIVIFSDGGDNSSYIDPMSLVQKVKQSNTVIYAIRNIAGQDEDPFYLNFMTNVCALSGGVTFRLSDIAGMQRVYDRIREDIRAQYLLHFSPKRIKRSRRRNRFYSLTVEVKKKNSKVRTLKGFNY